MNLQKEIRMSYNARSAGNLLGGLLIGAVIGAAAALLVAPQSGMQTRTMIKEKGSEVKDKIVSGAGETKTKAQQVVVGFRDRAGKWVRGMRRMNSGYDESDLEIINPEISRQGANL
jgi:gas vesicle protein